MQDNSTFITFVTKVLCAFGSGDYASIDLDSSPFDGEMERQAIIALRELQLRNRRIEDVLQQCVIGDYSVSIEEVGKNDLIGRLINSTLDKLREVVRQTNLISRGDYSAEISPQSAKDELGTALFEMTKALREIAEVSYDISTGDFSRQVRVKGERDYLAQIINQMVSNLREMERQAKAIAEGDYTLEIGPRSERDELSKSIDKIMKIIRSQLVALQQSNQDLEDFAHVASHDLNAPLYKIKYSCDLLKEACEGKLRGSVYQLFDVIMRSCNQMNQLIGDMLAHAKVGGSAAQFSDINLNDLVDGVILSLSHETEGAGARIIRDPLPVVFGDKTSLLRLFQNLISNALKYRSSDPLLVEIAAYMEKGSWIFSIKDNGIGIDPNNHQRIFDPYVRLHTASEIPGTGIGLATCSKIVKQLGGRIWVQSEVGRGSTFLVSLPKAASQTPALKSSEAIRKKVLLVDDDEDQLLILATILEKGNFEIETVDSPIKGLDCLKQQQFDIVISDVQMPHMNGAEFISAVRRQSTIPILMLTSSGPEREQELRDLGANDFCTKRDTFTQLISKVMALLRA